MTALGQDMVESLIELALDRAEVQLDLFLVVEISARPTDRYPG